MTRQIRLAKHVGIAGPRRLSHPTPTLGLAATTKMTAAQLGPQPAAPKLAAYTRHGPPARLFMSVNRFGPTRHVFTTLDVVNARQAPVSRAAELRLL
jgi:hypothetical protein